jgi:hypothetical protein
MPESREPPKMQLKVSETCFTVKRLHGFSGQKRT